MLIFPWLARGFPLNVELLGIKLVNLGGHDEITLAEAVDLVRPQRDLSFAPGEQNVGMMALLLRDRTYAIDEVERLLEIGKLECAGDVVLVDDVPVGELMAKRVKFRAVKRRSASAAGCAGFAGETGHGGSLADSLAQNLDIDDLSIRREIS